MPLAPTNRRVVMKKRVGWHLILSWVLAAFFVFAGGLNVAAPASIAQDYARWGYPDWFHCATGALELVSAVLLAWPARRRAGAALGALVMAAAITTLIISREWAHALIPFTALLALAVTFAPIAPTIPDTSGSRADG